MDDFAAPKFKEGTYSGQATTNRPHSAELSSTFHNQDENAFPYRINNRYGVELMENEYGDLPNCVQSTCPSNTIVDQLNNLCDIKFSRSPTFKVNEHCETIIRTDTKGPAFTNSTETEFRHDRHISNPTTAKDNSGSIGADNISIEPSSSIQFSSTLLASEICLEDKGVQNFCDQSRKKEYLMLKSPVRNVNDSSFKRIPAPSPIISVSSLLDATSMNCDPKSIIGNTANLAMTSNCKLASGNEMKAAVENTTSTNEITASNTTSNSNHSIDNQISTISTTIAISCTDKKVDMIHNGNGNASGIIMHSTQEFSDCSYSAAPITDDFISNKQSMPKDGIDDSFNDAYENQIKNSNSHLNLGSDSITSSVDRIDFDINKPTGYQDNSSSHSHQSGAGGAGGGGGGGGNGTNNTVNHSNVAGISLMNSVVGTGGNNSNTASGYMSLLPPAVGTTSSNSHLGGNTSVGTASAGHVTGDGIDFKQLFEELCPVCGDKVSGYHYGLLTCESCKGFFKRTVQNKKVYTCVAERSCHIDKTQRKRCPFCRFQKCLEVGMKLEAVRADRMRGGRNKFGPMYKRDRARKLQVMRQRQLALQALRTSIGSAEMKATPLSPGYHHSYGNMNIKQEIQIPQVSSLTQSPDSSPSPIAIALGQVNASSGVIATPVNSGSGAGGGGNNVNSHSNNSSDTINRVGTGSCHDAESGSLQNTAESKLCFDSGSHPSSTADSIIEPLRVSPMIRDFVQSIDDREWQTQLFALLQKQTYNQVEVDLFELMCKVLDQNLFSQVDWARNTVFFKDLKVDDQMKLLQHSWSDMLVLDHLHQRIHNGLPDETQLNNGQMFNLLGLGLLGVPQLADYFNELQNKLQDLKFDMGDYVCMKFLILLNPDVRGIINKKTVLEGHENVQAALLDYTLTCYSSVTDKFRRLLNILPDIHAMAARGEEHLYSKHCAGSAPTQTLLMEMLHAKRKV